MEQQADDWTADGFDEVRPTLTQRGYVVFLRGLALCGLIWGMGYWLRLIGWHDGAAWRFDTMDLEWRLAACSLAVLYPFAASGLWMLASWGIVVWTCAALIEIVMYAFFPSTFGFRPIVILFHLSAIALYVVWRVRIALENRDRRAEVEKA